MNVYESFPIINYKQEILVKDSLYLNPYQVFTNFIESIRNKDDNVKSIIFKGVNSVLFFLQQNQEMLGFSTIKMLNDFLD